MIKNDENFYGIDCRDICDLKEYLELKKQVTELCISLNKEKLRMEAENKKNKAQDGINKNSSIFYPIVLSWMYAIVAFASGIFYSDSDGLIWLIISFIFTFILCTIVAGMLANRSKVIYKIYRQRELFYYNICKIIDEI